MGWSLCASLGSSLGSSVASSLGSSLRSSLRSSLGSSLRSSLGSSLWSSLEWSLESGLWSARRSARGLSLRSSLYSSLRSSLRSSLDYSVFWGQHEGAWIAFYLYPELYLDVSYDPAFSEQLHLWEEVARSACWWWPHEGLCVISERPTVVEMEPVRPGTQEYRLHADNGPALVFADGWSVWSWHGVMVPEAVITKPESLAATEIRDERNAEV